LLPIVAAVAGCPSGGQSAGEALYLRLQDEDQGVRIQAMVQAADAGDPKAVPYLVENLGNDDSDVRMFAYVALKKITGQTMGYEYFDTRPGREQAIGRWRQWLSGGRQASATQTAPASQAQISPATASSGREARP
jgi:hypothetical protein